MKCQVILQPDGRIAAASGDSMLAPDSVWVDFPEEFDWNTMHEYKVEDGELVRDPLPETEKVPTLEDVMKELLGVDENE